MNKKPEILTWVGEICDKLFPNQNPSRKERVMSLVFVAQFLVRLLAVVCAVVALAIPAGLALAKEATSVNSDFRTALVEIPTRIGVDRPTTPENMKRTEGRMDTKFEITTNFLSVASNTFAAETRTVTPLHFAVWRSDWKTAESLIEQGANVNAKNRRGETLLHGAAATNAHEAASFLIKHGAYINVKDKDGVTPMHLAVWDNSVDVVGLLIKHGANIDNGRSLLHDAAITDYHKVAKILIVFGANIHAKDKLDATPLHTAAGNDSHRTAQLLIDGGANVNAISDIGFTPLHRAATSNAYKTAKILIIHGADVNARDDFGMTPLNLAGDANAHQTIKLLREHGGY